MLMQMMLLHGRMCQHVAARGDFQVLVLSINYYTTTACNA